MRFSRTRLTDVVHRRHSVLPASPDWVWGQQRFRRKPSSGVGLGRPVERPVQDVDFVIRGGSSHTGTHRILSCADPRQRSRGPSLTGGSVVRPAQSVLWPPPTPFRHRSHFPVVTGYRVRRSGRDTRVRAGEGLPSSRRHLLTIPRPVRRRVLHGCFQALHRFHGLHLEVPGSALSASTRRWPPHDAAGFALCYGLVSCSPLLGF